MEKLQSRVYSVIREDDENKLAGTLFDSVIIAFIVINILFIVLDTFDFSPWYQAVSRVVEIVAVVVFTLEYALRIWTAPLAHPDKKPGAARLKYLLSPMALVDLVSILPFYLPMVLPHGFEALRGLRVVRLFRVFKISRYNDALTVIGRVFKKKAHQLLSSTLVVFILMLIASMVMYDIESAAQPDKFDNAFSAFWWAVSTVTTVGYGDLYPITTAGKLIGAAIAFLGIGLVAVPTGIISAGFVEESRALEREQTAATKHGPHAHHAPNAHGKAYCPYCGNKLE